MLSSFIEWKGRNLRLKWIAYKLTYPNVDVNSSVIPIAWNTSWSFGCIAPDKVIDLPSSPLCTIGLEFNTVFFEFSLVTVSAGDTLKGKIILKNYPKLITIERISSSHHNLYYWLT